MLSVPFLATTSAVEIAWTGVGSHWRIILTIRRGLATHPATSAAGGLACQTASVGKERRGAGTWRTVTQAMSVSELQSVHSARMLMNEMMVVNGLLDCLTVWEEYLLCQFSWILECKCNPGWDIFQGGEGCVTDIDECTDGRDWASGQSYCGPNTYCTKPKECIS